MNEESFDPEEYIRQAERDGCVAVASAVAHVMNRAEVLCDSGDAAKAVQCLQAVAALDINDKSISVGAHSARDMLQNPDELVWSDNDGC